MAAIAGKTVPTNELVVIGTGAAMVIDLFLPWYRIEVFGSSFSANAFDAEFLAWFPALLVIAVGVLVALRIFQGFAMPTNSKVGPNLLLAGVSAVAFVLLLLRWATESDFTYIGLYFGILLAAAQAGFGFMTFKSSGEPMPGAAGRGGTPPPPPPAGGQPPTH